MKVLEAIELLVELVERVAGRYGLYLLRAGFGVMVNVEESF
jgi:hypothetical protein